LTPHPAEAGFSSSPTQTLRWLQKNATTINVTDKARVISRASRSSARSGSMMRGMQMEHTGGIVYLCREQSTADAKL
jgi:hypothetical protein